MKKAFTLIELLVAIAVIGILASVVLVSMNGAREKAQDARMISDVRSIAGYMEREKDFSDESYPAVSESTPTTVGDLTFPTSNSVDNGTFGWADNTSDPTKYCMWATLNNSSYFVANQSGTGYSSSEPSSISDCDFSMVAGGGGESEPAEPEPEPVEPGFYVLASNVTSFVSESQLSEWDDEVPEEAISSVSSYSFTDIEAELGPASAPSRAYFIFLNGEGQGWYYRHDSHSQWYGPNSGAFGASTNTVLSKVFYIVE